MRSVLATLFLALVALISVGLAALRLSDGSLARVFGAPAVQIGESLYQFDAMEASQIRLGSNGVSALCERGPGGWQVVEPWEDRMDPRVVQALFGFTLGARVEGAIPREKVESANLVFDDGKIAVRLANPADDPLAKFIIGHRTAWVGTDPQTGDTFPTVFLQPRDKSRKDYLYACTDAWDIHGLLGDGFKRLRDHRPFLFRPDFIETLRIRNRTGELLLSRKQPRDLFEIVKPLGLKSERDAVIELLQGLYTLEAVEVMSRSTVTLPGTAPEKIDQIALRLFGQEEEIVLEIHPPEEPSSTTVLATVSNRPNAVFRLPLNATAGRAEGGSLPGLNELPMSVNELRDPTLAAIAPRGLAGIMISPSVGDDILVRRESPDDRFQVMIDGQLRDASETALFSLLQAVNEGQVAEFVSDSATDLEPYGLESPFLILRFLGFDGSKLQLGFGQDADGNLHAIRDGTTTVVRLQPEMLGLIPTRPWDWRPPLVWKISSFDVSSVLRRQKDGPELLLGIVNHVTETWSARQDGEDVTDRLSTERAQILLENLLDLKAENWLPADGSAAEDSLKDPELIFTLFVTTFDDEGEKSGVAQRELRIARVKAGKLSLCYGSVSGEANPFLLDPEVVDLLAVDVLEDD